MSDGRKTVFQHIEARMDLQRAKPPGDDKYLGAVQGHQRMEIPVAGNGDSHRHTERGTGTSGVG